MLSELLRKLNLFYVLFRIDCDLADQTQQKRCPFCGGPLHISNYTRKPRGGPDHIPDEYLVRHSFCCGRNGCRKRCMPQSCRFWERKVYWSAVILVVLALRQNREKSKSVRKLTLLFGVSRPTIIRWMQYFREEFPSSNRWKCLRGRIDISVKNDLLPLSLLQYFLIRTESEEQGLTRCLCFLFSDSSFLDSG